MSLASRALPIVAGRVGSFGLIIQALELEAFDSGLARSEQFDLSALNRHRTQTLDTQVPSARGDKRLYVRQLKTTMPGSTARTLLEFHSLRGQLACDLSCCRFRSFAHLFDRYREHYLRVKCAESADLAGLPSVDMKVDRVHQELATAEETARTVRNAFVTKQLDPPDFRHLDRWLAVLGRYTMAPTEVRV
jgi:hypothetical protein